MICQTQLDLFQQNFSVLMHNSSPYTKGNKKSKIGNKTASKYKY